MNPNDRKTVPGASGPVMDVQRPPRPGTVLPPPTSVESPMAPADNIARSVLVDPVGQGTQATPAPKKLPKNRKPLIIALVSVGVLLLIGIGAGAFIIWQNSQTQPAANVSTQSENERVNVEEIDTTIAEIDKTLNSLNDSADITPNDVTDSSLGL